MDKLYMGIMTKSHNHPLLGPTDDTFDIIEKLYESKTYIGYRVSIENEDDENYIALVKKSSNIIEHLYPI